MISLDGNDKRAVHKMIRRLMKRGKWQAETCPHWGHLNKLSCGPVVIDRYGSDGHVKVLVDGVQIAHSFYVPWGSLGSSAKGFFDRQDNAARKQQRKNNLAKARAALLKTGE